jgi:hypothetical protein
LFIVIGFYFLFHFQIENLSVSFSDGRALCYLLHHYYPSFLKKEDISDETTQQQQQQNGGDLNDSSDINYGNAFETKSYEECLNNEKQNFKLIFNKVSFRFISGSKYDFFTMFNFVTLDQPTLCRMKKIQILKKPTP